MVLLLAIVAGALALRLDGLERRGMTHNEVYVPGIALPAGISEPPPRIGLLETVWWHFHDEPHPQGYYFFMWGWTRVFGTSLIALRMPSVLFGVAAVLLLYMLATRLFDSRTGLVSAALLAANGHQIFWSQWARNYMVSCLLGIASTLLLVSLLRSQRREPGREAAYVALTWLALFTQLLSWGLLGGQILVALRYARGAWARFPRVLQLQGLVTILGTPLLAHAVYRSRPTEMLDGPVWKLLRDFFNFGFLFEPDDFSDPARAVPVLLAVALTVGVVVSLAFARRRSLGERTAGGGGEALGMGPTALLAVGVSLVVLGLASIAYRRQLPMALTAVVPFVVLGVLRQAVSLWPHVARGQQALDRRSHMSDSLGLVLILGLVPMLLLSAVHLIKPILTSRGAIPFPPFLLIAIASGIVAMSSRRMMAGLVGLGLLGVHAASVLYYRAIPAPNDYRSIGTQINREFRGEDLVFVPSGSWVTTPLFYHLHAPADRLVTADFAKALAAHPGGRVWVPLFSGQQPSDEMKTALAGFRMETELTAFRGRALLYVR
jgi:4-amino-4-deoxy-L-arabinose transferase-like glycosyltransferase